VNCAAPAGAFTLSPMRDLDTIDAGVWMTVNAKPYAMKDSTPRSSRSFTHE
jgi:hypothetical protein